MLTCGYGYTAVCVKFDRPAASLKVTVLDCLLTVDDIQKCVTEFLRLILIYEDSLFLWTPIGFQCRFPNDGSRAKDNFLTVMHVVSLCSFVQDKLALSTT